MGERRELYHQVLAVGGALPRPVDLCGTFFLGLPQGGSQPGTNRTNPMSAPVFPILVGAMTYSSNGDELRGTEPGGTMRRGSVARFV
jgi:hypothetical protein